MLKKLALLVALVCGPVTAQTVAGTVTLDPNTIYNTGNIVNSGTSPTNTTGTWQNVGLWNQGLPCWGPGGPVYCGPLPYYNQGSFNFSYGTSDVYQTANVNNVLSSIGSGLRVNGYNFGFTAKNGNGWDDGRVDYLVAYVHFNDPNNNVVYNKSYDLNSKFNWTTFKFSETFETPFASKDLGTVTYGFVGRDNNFWAGPYGPEVTNVNFSLKYSVDPCATNPLYSPTCPGYLDALAKLVPATTVTVSTTSLATTEPATTLPPAPANVINTTSLQPTVISPVISAPAPAASSTSTPSTSSSSNNKESQPSNTSLALSIINKNSERDSSNLSIAQTAVSQAQAAAQQAQQEAANIASNAVANSQTANIVSVNGQQSSGNGLRVSNSTSNSTSMTVGSVMAPGAVVVSALTPQMQSSVFATPVVISNIIEQPQVQQVTVLPNNSSTTSTVQNYSIVPLNFLTDKSNPLTEIVEGRQSAPPSSNVVMTGPSVNRNASDNDAAGGVSLDKMALAPRGYGDYLNFTLRDVAFYAPKEVYRNQKNVDNARALRQLTNDNRHQEMVEQQYRR